MGKSIEQIIDEGEGLHVEFKPNLLFNHSSGKPGISIKQIIAKAICGFLNREGGILIIGLSDKGEIQGLHHDFKLAVNKSPKDFFQQEYRDMLRRFIYPSIISLVHGKFEKIGEKDLFVVTVEPNRRKPVFLNGQNGKEFYVRDVSSTESYSDIEQIVDYCIDHWNKSH